MRSSAVAWLIAGIALAPGMARLGLVIDDAGGPGAIAGVDEPESSVPGVLLEALLSTLFTAIGALVASRRPRNPVGGCCSRRASRSWRSCSPSGSAGTT